MVAAGLTPDEPPRPSSGPVRAPGRGTLDGMAALIIGWDPGQPGWTGVYAADVETVRRTGVVRQEWQVPGDPALVEGLDVWLLAVGARPAQHGLIGHGTLAAIRSPTCSEAGSVEIDVDLDLLLPRGDQVPCADVAGRLPDLRTGEPPVRFIDGPAELAVRMLWAEANPPDRASLDPLPGALPASAVRRVPVNGFERDQDLRRVAMAHRGSVCHACGLDPEQVYGIEGPAVMQVHHITPHAHLEAGYEVDPLVDLIPLCPTCHVVAHSRWPEPYGVEDIRTMLRGAGFLRGSVLTPEQLESEAAAARILGT